MNNAVKQPLQEKAIFARRSALLLFFVGFAFVVLMTRYFYLQIMEHDHYLKRSEDNRIKFDRLKSPRGLIYDRNGVLLADNITAYRIQVIPEKVSTFSEQLQRLAPILELSETDQQALLEKTSQRKKLFKPVIIKDKLTEAEVARFAVQQHHFPGFSLEPYLSRAYMYPEIMSHVIGHVGKIDETEYGQKDRSIYAIDDYIGKIGLEKSYELPLHGLPGVLRNEIDVRGRLISSEIQEKPIQGKNLYLTIDVRLQQATHQAFGNETGSAIVVDTRNGHVLAMLSKPGFDTNQFINGISREHFKHLLDSPDKPMFNRSIAGGYEPGSTIKPFIALAGLHYDVIDANYRMFSGGSFQLPNQKRKYHDWKQGGHGRVDVVDALAESVNTFFYQLAVDLGIDRIQTFLQYFGYGQRTGIDITGEKAGILPSREWKRAARNTIWYPGETVITGIGQGFFVVTPVQMAHAVTILASKGQITRLHLVQRETRTSELSLDIAPEHWELVHQGMENVINAANGTARAIRSDEIRIAGKSGTSQVYGKSEEDIYKKNEDLPKHLRNHGLFIAFAPAENPEIAVVVVAEHGASGSKAAAPIARKIIDSYMELSGYEQSVALSN